MTTAAASRRRLAKPTLPRPTITQRSAPRRTRVDDRVIHADLKVRRQFDIDYDKLRACFDTTVAIEDPLLLSKLSERHSEKLQAITATVRREQNKVIRHDDVDVPCWSTASPARERPACFCSASRTCSTAIARIWFPRRCTCSRPTLFSAEVTLDSVLPDMGESNPQITTWNEFFDQRGLTGRGMAVDVPAQNLRALEEAVKGLALADGDCDEHGA